MNTRPLSRSFRVRDIVGGDRSSATEVIFSNAEAVGGMCGIYGRVLCGMLEFLTRVLVSNIFSNRFQRLGIQDA